MKRIILSYIIIMFCCRLFAQGYDNMWLMGYDSYPGNTEWGGTTINFSADTFDMYYTYRKMNLRLTNAAISDKNGNLLFYTNGYFIANALGDTMENGSGINPEGNTNDLGPDGLMIPQGAVIVPNHTNSNIYYLFHEAATFMPGIGGGQPLHLFFSVIDMSQSNGLGKVISKNNILIDDTISLGQLNIVKHGNGHDYWLLVPRYKSNKYYTILISNTLPFSYFEQSIGPALTTVDVGQVCFSPDGSKYARYDMEKGGLYLYRFDRCTGILSEPLYQKLNDGVIGGVAISPNSQFVYATAGDTIWQYDLDAADILATKTQIAIFDGFVDGNAPWYTTFSLAQLAPNGKIYISTGPSTRYFHIIHSPNNAGLACGLEQHGLHLPTWNAFSIPNYPNYHLGVLQGSSCDTITTTTSKPLEIANIYAYPNPTKDKLFVGGNHIGNRAVLSLCNSLGQEVYHHIWENTQIETAISMAALPQGVYYLRVLAGDKVFTEKIVRE